MTSKVYFTGCFDFTSTMLSGPPGRQNEQVWGIAASTKCVCFSPICSGSMNPCIFTSFLLSAATLAENCGT
jgi:hypothetical protein